MYSVPKNQIRLEGTVLDRNRTNTGLTTSGKEFLQCSLRKDFCNVYGTCFNNYQCMRIASVHFKYFLMKLESTKQSHC